MQAETVLQSSRGLSDLARDLRAVRRNVRRTQQELLASWASYLQRKEYLPAVSNLAAYIALRRQDTHELQARLARYGLSTLGRCEGHVIPALDTLLYALDLMNGQTGDPLRMERLANTRAHDGQLAINAARVLGPAPGTRAVRIMVTLPSEAAHDAAFVRELVARGMDCARINCAHDDPVLWKAMIDQVRRAARELDCRCRILMDLAGPRIRTGPMMAGPQVLHVKPKRDAMGRVISPAMLLLHARDEVGMSARQDQLGRMIPAHLSVEAAWLDQVHTGDQIELIDARGRLRRLVAGARLSAQEVLVSAETGFYITPETRLRRLPQKRDPQPRETRCGPIAAISDEFRALAGDDLLLTRDGRPGGRGTNGLPNHVSCLPPEVLDHLQVGESVFIDEGRIKGRIESLDEAGALVRLVHTRPGGDRIRGDKGINFPESTLRLPALTEKDMADLDFIAKHAELVGYSFVQSGDDMDRLIAALHARGADQMGIIAKIETRRAVHNLPEIIVHGAGRHPLGIMLTRSDLAVEIGYERWAEIQEELLWICEAAHIPIVWATQALESLVKRGLSSRAEITDTAMAERAACIMINKGPFVLDAIAMLDDVAERMQIHQRNTSARIRALHW